MYWRRGGCRRDTAHYAPFTAMYNATWLGVKNAKPHGVPATLDARSSTALNLGVSFLIDGLATDAAQFAAKRSGSGPFLFHLSPGVAAAAGVAGWLEPGGQG